MRLLVTGARDWKDSRTVYWALRTLRDAQRAKGDPTEPKNRATDCGPPALHQLGVTY